MNAWLRALAAPVVHEARAGAGTLARRTMMVAAGAFAFLVAGGFVVAAAYTAIATSYGDIAAQLSKDYNAPQEDIEADIITMLQDLADKGVVKA